jgi:hypothetical protein
VNAFSVNLGKFWRVDVTFPIFVTIGPFGGKDSTQFGSLPAKEGTSSGNTLRRA